MDFELFIGWFCSARDPNYFQNDTDSMAFSANPIWAIIWPAIWPMRCT